ncbi:hypothetical protein L207DRAFT_339038 [Hyaloscypha variabilis F]|uniref:2EXR domain-containing protein n=1 Tax=Hyaloscypha variabilis (strain UAMH 11265 / GT02V1 / F) TaxID=1149755 RepID=A0A2J6RPN4_HYAVF|nr:hypothetical protein L207DRAFT_339038 [Hyaloscypha variabilis F]
MDRLESSWRGGLPQKYLQSLLYWDCSFPQFSRLPIELRERIWQHTLPGPRLIEVGKNSRDTTSSEAAGDPCFTLRILGNFSARHSIPTEQVQLRQQWFSPVALFVCHESRQHTLRHYRLIEQPEINLEPFYCDPPIDILWFTYEFTGHAVNMRHVELQSRMDQLCHQHPNLLNLFKTVLVDEIFWNPESGNQDYLSHLLSLETILIMDTSRQDASCENAVPIVYDCEDLQHFIVAGKKECTKFKERRPNWPLKNIEYLARGTVNITHETRISLGDDSYEDTSEVVNAREEMREIL